ncbi:hypothetical protein KFK09_026500 [Dendrobium nobile]|uniref:Uncharacterized protein n=1 Tax=Dendrobium nobile TaxID=94219 RepID=A0A8T3A8D6_DENNO|nr:hypothetical protein KFK09_026500 [Dendrobium nobile]
MVLWRKDLASFYVLEASSEMIVGKLDVSGKGSKMVASVYGSNDIQNRRTLWTDLEKHCSGNLPFVVGDDFNCIISQAKKRGGKKFLVNQGFKDFNNFIIRNDLHEIKSMGPRFTWCNNKKGGARILEKLDRCLINTIALDCIDIALVKHVSRVASDHCPILLEVFKPLEHTKSTIRYEEVWASYYGASALVKSVWKRNCKGDPATILNLKFKRTLKALFYWSKEKYKGLNALRDKLKDEILEIQLEESEGVLSVERLQILRFKINELNVTLARINTWWRKRAKARWMDEGNCNTSFFHEFASARRSSNWISHIKTGSGIFLEEESVIQDTFSDFFRCKWQFRDCILEGWLRPSNVLSLEDQGYQEGG